MKEKNIYISLVEANKMLKDGDIEANPELSETLRCFVNVIPLQIQTRKRIRLKLFTN